MVPNVLPLSCLIWFLMRLVVGLVYKPRSVCFIKTEMVSCQSGPLACKYVYERLSEIVITKVKHIAEVIVGSIYSEQLCRSVFFPGWFLQLWTLGWWWRCSIMIYCGERLQPHQNMALLPLWTWWYLKFFLNVSINLRLFFGSISPRDPKSLKKPGGRSCMAAPLSTACKQEPPAVPLATNNRQTELVGLAQKMRCTKLVASNCIRIVYIIYIIYVWRYIYIYNIYTLEIGPYIFVYTSWIFMNNYVFTQHYFIKLVNSTCWTANSLEPMTCQRFSWIWGSAWSFFYLAQFYLSILSKRLKKYI